MGQDTRSIFQYLKDEGYNFLIGGFHVKGQVIDAKGVSAWGYGGQTMERGDWIGRQAVAEPGRSAQRLEEAGRALRARAAGHGAARSAGVPAEPHASTGSIISWRRASCCTLDVAEHASRRRARVPEGAHPGSRAAEADPAGIDRVRPPHRRSGGVACTRCSTRCWRRRASRSRASAGRRTARSAHVTHRTRRQDGRRHRRHLRHRPDDGDRPRRRRRQRRRHRPPGRADRRGRRARSKRMGVRTLRQPADVEDRASLAGPARRRRRRPRAGATS